MYVTIEELRPMTKFTKSCCEGIASVIRDIDFLNEHDKVRLIDRFMGLFVSDSSSHESYNFKAKGLSMMKNNIDIAKKLER